MKAGADAVLYFASGGRTENVMTLRGSIPIDSPRRRARVANMRLPPVSSTSASATSMATVAPRMDSRDAPPTRVTAPL